MSLEKNVEILKYKVDLDSLVQSLNEVKKVGPMVFQGSEFGYKSFGGWNLQSRTGDYRDGFQVGIERCYRKNGTFNYHLAKFLNYSHAFEHKNPTQACTDAIKQVLEFLEDRGFYPRRARLTCLKAHSKSIIHRDAPADKYLARIHIPLITNDKCTHWTEHTGSFHMPSDGSVYMLWVNNMHQIKNESDEDRYHIIMDAYDTYGFTRNFKYNGDICFLINEAAVYRERIKKTNLSLMRKIAYTIGRQVYMTKFKIEQKMLFKMYNLNENNKKF
jgi:hypothetical protein